MTPETVIQCLILTTGALSMLLISCGSAWARSGFVLGLAGQPFWLYTTSVNSQWGMAALSIVYTLSFINGLRVGRASSEL